MLKVHKGIYKIMLALMVLSVPQLLYAQDEVESYKFDFGAGLGMSGYLGDANGSNLYAHPGFAFNLEGRYLMDSRWSLRAQFTYATISGNSGDMENVFPGHAVYDFKANVYDLGFRGEFNFFPYGIGETYKRLKRWTPFMSLGVGVSVSSCAGNTAAGFNIPMGFGFRYKLKRRVNLSAEFTMTKVFSDRMDGTNLKDPYQIKSSFIKNTDWYSTIMVGISYEFGPRCVTCHRLD